MAKVDWELYAPKIVALLMEIQIRTIHQMVQPFPTAQLMEIQIAQEMVETLDKVKGQIKPAE
jgi:hypothetical protein